jgi:hypothetical protein
MNKYFMGVDPGMTGAAAFVNEAGEYRGFIDYPGSASFLFHELTRMIGNATIVLTVIEHVHLMPKQGIVSGGKFMRNFGILEGVVAALELPYELITPQRWRKILDSSVPLKPTKEDLRQYVIKRWPASAEDLKRKKDHNRSEAILIAEYARLKYLGKIR